jgi:hypothetical protein
MNVKPKVSITLLALAGITSSLIVLICPTVFGIAAVGGLFGLSLCTYFALYEQERNRFKLVAFLFVSIASYPVSAASGVIVSAAWNLWGPFESSASRPPTTALWVYYVSGYIGTVLILAAGALAFGPRNVGKGLDRRVLLWSNFGALLAVAGGAVNNALILKPQLSYNSFWFVGFIWESGVPIILGALLRSIRQTVPAQASRSVTSGAIRDGSNIRYLATAGIYIICIIVSLVVLRSRQNYERYDSPNARYEAYVAHPPSTVNLPAVKPLELSQALIVAKIDGVDPDVPRQNQSYTPNGPLALDYSLGYGPQEDRARYGDRHAVEVSVTQYPDDAWAQYEAQAQMWDLASGIRPWSKKVIVIGQAIFEDSSKRSSFDGNETLCYFWPSHQFVVTTCFQTNMIDEAFLDAYLRKYPSSL